MLFSFICALPPGSPRATPGGAAARLRTQSRHGAWRSARDPETACEGTPATARRTKASEAAKPQDASPRGGFRRFPAASGCRNVHAIPPGAGEPSHLTAGRETLEAQRGPGTHPKSLAARRLCWHQARCWLTSAWTNACETLGLAASLTGDQRSWLHPLRPATSAGGQAGSHPHPQGLQSWEGSGEGERRGEKTWRTGRRGGAWGRSPLCDSALLTGQRKEGISWEKLGPGDKLASGHTGGVGQAWETGGSRLPAMWVQTPPRRAVVCPGPA